MYVKLYTDLSVSMTKWKLFVQLALNVWL